jgi:hypothetical protein
VCWLSTRNSLSIMEPDILLSTMPSRAHVIHYPMPVDSSPHTHIFFR